jgi:hypothetical protein
MATLNSNSGSATVGVKSGFSKVDGTTFYATLGWGTAFPGDNAINMANRVGSDVTMLNNNNFTDLSLDGNHFASCTPYKVVTMSNGSTGAVDMYPFNMPMTALWTRPTGVTSTQIYFSIWLQTTKDLPKADASWSLSIIQVV